MAADDTTARSTPCGEDNGTGSVAVRGEAAVTLGPGEERQEERIPEQLRRFL